MSDSRKKQAEQILDENIAKILQSKSEAELEKYVDDFCTESVTITGEWPAESLEFKQAIQAVKQHLENAYKTGIINNQKLLTFVQLIPYMYHYMDTYIMNKNENLNKDNILDVVRLSFDIAAKENLDTAYDKSIFTKEKNFRDLEIDFLENLNWNTGLPTEDYRKYALSLGFISEKQLHDIEPQEKILNEKIQSLEQLEEKEKENIKEKFNNAIQRLLTEKKDVDTLYQSGMTPLMYASYLGHKQAVDLLLKNKADVKQGTPGRTPLRYAMTGENIEVIQALLEAKAGINEQTPKTDNDIPYHITPLIAATESGQTKVVETLLKYKADIKKTDNKGDSALHYATRLGHREIMDILLKNNADVNGKNSTGGTPLITAAREEQEMIVKELLDCKADIKETNLDGDAALHVAASEGREKTVDILLSAKAEVNQGSFPPLLCAAINGHSRVVEKLLIAKADFKKQDSSGRTALIIAANTGHADVVEKLLINDEIKLTIDQVDNDNYSALIHATSLGKTKAVKVLLKYKADVNQRIKTQTALGLAAKAGHFEIVKVLLDAKANGEIKNAKGKTPLHYAEENKHEEIVELLKDAQHKSALFASIASKSTSAELGLMTASEKGWTDVVDYLLTNNATINAVQNGDTALMLAIQNNHLETVNTLLDKKADLQCNNSLGQTPLNLACEYRHMDIVKALLKHNAEINTFASSGHTALMKAADRGDDEIVKLLCKEKAFINQQDKDGNTSLIYAIVGGHLEIVNSLLGKKADIDNKNRPGKTALDYAKIYNHDSISNLLQTYKMYRICNNLDAIILSATRSKDQYVTQRQQLKELIQLSKKEFNETEDLKAKENIYQKLVDQTKQLTATSTTTSLSDTLSKVGLYKEKMEEPEDFVSQVNTVLKKLG